MKKPNIWRDYNGPGKPITEAQIIELLSKYGIKPRIGPNGKSYFHREDFEQIWKHYGIGTTKGQH